MDSLVERIQLILLLDSQVVLVVAAQDKSATWQAHRRLLEEMDYLLLL
jgi:hypothetical protein